MISEMIHTASLVHDDVIDGSDKRRGKTTINEVWGERKVSGVPRPGFCLLGVASHGVILHTTLSYSTTTYAVHVNEGNGHMKWPK